MARTSLHNAQPLDQQPQRQAYRTPERGVERATERREERRLERPDNRRLTDDGRFSIDLNRVPEGYVMEFKRHTIMGMEDKRNQVLIRQYHWQPVPHKLQPHILGHLCKNEDEHIIVDGCGLYMRPKYLNQDAAEEHRRETDFMLSQQLQSLRLQSKDQVGERNTYIKKSTVSVPQPVE